jgi:autotransporter translocation and assembly factor TamB
MRWLVGLTLAAGLLLVATVVVLWLAADSRFVHEIVRRRVVAALAGALDGEVSVARTSGHLGRSLVLEDVRVAVGGRTVARVARVAADYDASALLSGRIRVERLLADGLRLRAVHDADGWRLPVLREEEPERDSGGGLPLDIERVEVRDGRAAVALLDAQPVRRFAATALTAEGSIAVRPQRTEIRIASLGATPRGIDVSPLRATATLLFSEDGAFEVRSLDVTTARSRLSGSARFAHDQTVAAHLVTTPLAARELRALVPELDVHTDVRLATHATGAWSDLALALRLDLGRAGAVTGMARLDLQATPIRHALVARLTALDPGGAISGLPRARLDGRVRTAGTGFGRATPIAYELKLGSSEVDGQHVRSLRVAGRGSAGLHRARGRIGIAAGDVAWRARVHLPALAYRVRTRLAVDHPEVFAPGLTGWVAARARLRGRGLDAPERRAALDVVLDGAELRGLRLTGGTLAARLAQETVTIARAEVAGPGTRLAAAGSIDLTRRSTRLTLDGTSDLRAMAVSAGTSGTGIVLLRGSVSGPFDALAVQASADAGGLAYGTVTAREGHAVVDLSGVGGSRAGGTARLDVRGLQLGTRAPMLVNAGADWRRTTGTDRVKLDASARRDDGAAADLSLTLAHAGAHTTGELRDLRVQPVDEPPWRLVRPATFRLDDGITVDGLALAAGEQRAALAGHIAAAGTNAASLTLTRVSLAPLCTLARRRPCDGALSGQATLAGTAASPRLDADFSATDVAVDKVAYGALTLGARYAERDAAVRVTLRHPKAGELLLDGHVPVDLAWAGERRRLDDAPLALTLSASELDLTLLATLAPDTVRRVSGRARVSLRITGPRSNPRAEGTIEVDAERIELVAAGVPYESVRVRLEARGSTLHVVEMSATSGKGTLTGAGDLAIAASGATVALRLQFADFFAVRRQAFEGDVSGELEIGGSLAAPDIRGTIQVVRALIRPAALPASGLNLSPDPTITVVKAAPAAEPPPPPPPPGVGDRLRLGIDIEIARNALIRRDDAHIELGGELRVEKEPFAPVRLKGRIRLLRGWYAFQGRRFDIDEGTVSFHGEAPPQPTLNVTASHRTELYLVTVHIEGSGDKPTLTLSSDPPLEQADILAVLLFGTPAGQLGSSQAAGLQDKALDLAAGYVMPGLRSSVMNTLGLDALDVRMPGDETTPGRCASVAT